MVTRIVLYATLGVLCYSLGFAWNSIEFWSFLGLYWCSDLLAREEGRLDGVAVILEMPMMQIAALKSLLDRADAGEDITNEEVKKELDKHDEQ